MDNNTYLLNLDRNLILLTKALEVIREFEKRDIESLILKGLYLAFNVYPNPGLRPMTDIDLLVKRDDLKEIEEVLNILGYAEVSPQAHKTYGCDATFCSKDGVYLDIHWDLCQYERFKGIIKITDDFWRRASEFILDEIPLKTLSIEDHILYVSLHYYLVHMLYGLNGACDLFYLINKYSPDWKMIIDNTYRYGIRTPVFYSLLKASGQMGLKLPDFVLGYLRPSFLKKILLDYIISKDDKILLRYLSQALMMDDFANILKVLWRLLKGIPRLLERRNHNIFKNIPETKIT